MMDGSEPQTGMLAGDRRGPSDWSDWFNDRKDCLRLAPLLLLTTGNLRPCQYSALTCPGSALALPQYRPVWNGRVLTVNSRVKFKSSNFLDKSI